MGKLLVPAFHNNGSLLPHYGWFVILTKSGQSVIVSLMNGTSIHQMYFHQ